MRKKLSLGLQYGVLARTHFVHWPRLPDPTDTKGNWSFARAANVHFEDWDLYMAAMGLLGAVVYLVQTPQPDQTFKCLKGQNFAPASLVTFMYKGDSLYVQIWEL